MIGNETSQYFEGPEKKVELVVHDGSVSLRRFGDAAWHRIVKAAGAQVLSKISTAELDAYLLSESSLFVWDDHVAMITCGNTRLVRAIAKMLAMIPEEAVAMLVFERKNEHFPRRQETSFIDDARRLSAMMPGVAFQFGSEHSHCIRLFHTSASYAPDPDDTTLEILMHGLSPSTAETFCGMERAPREPLAARLGLDRLLPGFEIDEYAFRPAGYSLNAIKDHLYYTIHVTPERIGSYVSFETNWDFRADAASLISRVVEIFDPGSFDVMAYEPNGAPLAVHIPGFDLVNHVSERIYGYQTTFQYFSRQPRGPKKPIPLRF